MSWPGSAPSAGFGTSVGPTLLMKMGEQLALWSDNKKILIVKWSFNVSLLPRFRGSFVFISFSFILLLMHFISELRSFLLKFQIYIISTCRILQDNRGYFRWIKRKTCGGATNAYLTNCSVIPVYDFIGVCTGCSNRTWHCKVKVTVQRLNRWPRQL